MIAEASVITAGRPGGPVAVVISPVLPSWDRGAFCAPLVTLLASLGYEVHVYDSVSLAVPHGELARTVASWDALLRARHPRIDLAVGQAFGGALLQHLLGGTLAECAMAIGVSAPTIVGPALRTGLLDILAALNERGPAQALLTLDRWVGPARTTAEAAPVVEPGCADRLRSGFQQLLQADARQHVRGYGGRLLMLYGEASRLVNRDSIVLGGAPGRHLAVGISGCEMRPLADAPDVALGLIRHFLESAARAPGRAGQSFRQGASA